MDDDLGADWPSEEEITPEPEEAVEATAPESERATETEAAPSSSDDEETVQELTPEEPEPVDTSWSLPIRAAPILALQGESVTEFPLSQHVSGYESTSVIMDEELMRIVEARYDTDGVRRLNVRMTLVKQHISGYSHTHLDLFHKLRILWWASLAFGLILATPFAQGLLVLGGSLFVLTGLFGMLLTQLDLHRISFSDHGGRHDFYLSGWRQEPYLIHNSTALLGPAIVDFLRTGTLDTHHIDAVVEALGQPPEPAPSLKQAPAVPEASPPSTSTPSGVSVLPEPAPPTAGPPVTGPPVSVAAQAEPMPPLPPPPAALPKPSPPASPSPATPTLPPPPPASPTLPPSPPATPSLPAPLPPAPLPPPVAMSKVDEDALWDDLN
jgi:hypothetical protein